MYDFSKPVGPDLLLRTQAFEDWRARRSEVGVWPFSRVLHAAPGPDMAIADEQGRGGAGISLACQDYLGLTSHPAIREAAQRALHDLGPHSAGSPALAGNTALSLQLERELGEALGFEHIALFPTGWGAGFGSIAGLVRPDDHIVMDQLSHACLQQGAFAATRNVIRHAHLDVEAARKILRDIRAEDSRNGIMVITEGLFSMDSDVPDIGALQDACREFGATLLVDVAHDFGALGPRGGGSLGAQDLLGKVDLVMGSFSKTFASNGGFMATRSSAVRQYMKFYGSPQTFSNALSPVQTAVVREALRVVRAPEGDVLRSAMLHNAETLRGAFAAHDIHCIGVPSAIVPAFIGDEAVGRIAWSLAQGRGVHANLVEFPAVAVGSARFRMQVMATHGEEQLLQAVDIISQCIAEAKQAVAQVPLQRQRQRSTFFERSEFATAAKALPSLKQGDLQKLLAVARTETHQADDTFIRAGANSGVLYVVQRGMVRVEVDYLGHPVVLAEFGEGEVIGEMSLLDGKGASASVVAETDVEVACLDQATIATLAKSDPELGMRLYQSLAMVVAGRLRTRNVLVTPFEFVG